MSAKVSNIRITHFLVRMDSFVKVESNEIVEDATRESCYYKRRRIELNDVLPGDVEYRV